MYIYHLRMHVCIYTLYLIYFSTIYPPIYLVSTFFYYRKHGVFDKLNENNKASSNDKKILLSYPWKSLYLIQIDVEWYKKTTSDLGWHMNDSIAKHFYNITDNGSSWFCLNTSK